MLRALVVDDAADCRDLLAYHLDLCGFAVSTAADGERGLSLVRSFEPDVVILDLALPGLSGFVVARIVRASDPDRRLAIIAVTGLTSPQIAAEARAVGCDIVLHKPLDSAMVVEQAYIVLARHLDSVAGVSG